MNEKRHGILGRLDPVIWVLLLTALAYASAYGYECGYLSWFGIPSELAEVDLRDLLICVAAFVGGAAVVIPLAALLDVPVPRVPQRLVRDTVYLLLLLLGVWGGLSTDKPLSTTWKIVSTCAIAFAGLGVFYILPAFMHPFIKGYWAKVIAASEERQSAVRRAAVRDGTPVFEKLNLRVLIVAMLVVACPFIAYEGGEFGAERQVLFLVPMAHGIPQCVVVRSSSSGLLCATYQVLPDNMNQLCGEYQFLKTEGSVMGLRIVGSILPNTEAVTRFGSAPRSIRLEVRHECVANAIAQLADSEGKIDSTPLDSTGSAPGAHSNLAQPPAH
jgi:hypothetical protein